MFHRASVLASSCKHGYEFSGSIKTGTATEWLWTLLSGLDSEWKKMVLLQETLHTFLPEAGNSAEGYIYGRADTVKYWG
jgi:hypothetical protein